jgi:hypothetical protein
MTSPMGRSAGGASYGGASASSSQVGSSLSRASWTYLSYSSAARSNSSSATRNPSSRPSAGNTLCHVPASNTARLPFPSPRSLTCPPEHSTLNIRLNLPGLVRGRHRGARLRAATGAAGACLAAMSLPSARARRQLALESSLGELQPQRAGAVPAGRFFPRHRCREAPRAGPRPRSRR